MRDTRDVVDADLSSPLGPTVSLRRRPTRRALSQIDHREVHRDRADHRRTTPAYHHLAAILKSAPIAVGVADREHADRARPRRDEVWP